MKITVKSVATVMSTKPMDPGTLALAANNVVGKSVNLTLEPNQLVSELNSAALAAFAFDSSINVTKVVCEVSAPVADTLTLSAAGISDGSIINCRFTISI
jgi:hypothetical protein